MSNQPARWTLDVSSYDVNDELVRMRSEAYTYLAHFKVLSQQESEWTEENYDILNTLFSNTLSLCSSLNVRDQVSHPYRTTGKIIVLNIGWQIGKDLKTSCCRLIDVLRRHLHGGTEEKNEKHQSGYSVSRPRFEPRTSRIWVWKITATRTQSAKLLYLYIQVGRAESVQDLGYASHKRGHKAGLQDGVRDTVSDVRFFKSLCACAPLCVCVCINIHTYKFTNLIILRVM
jgi:hypothetical protein